jgi:hypothetical protein
MELCYQRLGLSTAALNGRNVLDLRLRNDTAIYNTCHSPPFFKTVFTLSRVTR